MIYAFCRSTLCLKIRTVTTMVFLCLLPSILSKKVMDMDDVAFCSLPVLGSLMEVAVRIHFP